MFKMIILWGIYNDISTGFNININDCYFKSCFPLHCAMISQPDSTLTLMIAILKVVFPCTAIYMHGLKLNQH